MNFVTKTVNFINETSLGKNLDENGDKDYKAYFAEMLKKHGYKSPGDIPADKKKEFFNAVDKGYKAKNETD